MEELLSEKGRLHKKRKMKNMKNRSRFILFLGLVLISLGLIHKCARIENRLNATFLGHRQNDPIHSQHVSSSLEINNPDFRIESRGGSNLLVNTQDFNAAPRDEQDIPFFWVIPKSGTSSIKSILAKCLHLRMASSTKAIDYEEEAKKGKIRVIDNESQQGGRFVNVDFGYLTGIHQAKQWKMASSGVVDVAVSSYLHEAVDTFTTSNSARVFTIFRHPVQRMVSDFYYQQIATWEKTYQVESKPTSLLDYAMDGRYHVDNWVTRQIANVHSGPVTDEDYEYAKEFIHTKVLVLFLDEIDDSIERLLTYMNWKKFLDEKDINTETGKYNCLDAFMHNTPSNQNPHSKIEEGSEEWVALEKINYYDIKLYSFSLELFHGEQKEFIDSTRKLT